MKKHLATLTFGCSLFLATSFASAAFSSSEAMDDAQLDERVEPVFYGSCEFKGQFASGCMEFTDGAWTDASMDAFCQKSSKEGSVATLVKTSCDKPSYNAVCVSKEADGSVVNTYVNNMPAFICKKYLNGELSKRPATGW